jgi:hypothetical protein
MYDQSMNKDRIRNLSLGTRLYQFFFFSRAKIRGKKKRPKLFFFKKKTNLNIKTSFFF